MRPLALLFLLAAAAAADEAADRIFRVWDANGDGVLTAQELPDADMFAKVDADADGKITPAEVAAFLGRNPEGAKKGSGDAKPPEPPPEGKSEAAPMPDPRTLKERVADFFRRFDRNKNGKIERDEFQGGDEAFKEYDRSRNGALSTREVTRYIDDQLDAAKRNPRPDNFFDLFDLDRDRRVTRKEYDGPNEFFRRYDHDKDRVVTEEELNMGPEGGPGREMREGDAEFMADGPTRMPRMGVLDRYDADGDGRVTLEEMGGAASVLQRLDKNGDGVLSGTEVR